MNNEAMQADPFKAKDPAAQGQEGQLNPHQVQALMSKAVIVAGKVVLGKERQIRLALSCMAARGHLLLEDLPGVGKTTLSHVLARILGVQFNRIQFTSDLLPSDILGASIFDRNQNSFHFHPGPIFSHVVLADEVNRATPKCQSALLEAMEEHQVTIEGETHPLPEPFFVIATQNPIQQIGTFPLPESQLDRFLMRLTMGYPDRQAERDLLKGVDRRQLLTRIPRVISPRQLFAIQTAVPTVHVSEALLDYVQAIIQTSRRSQEYTVGLSPRGGLALIRAAQAWALIHGRNHVLPEDVQAVLPAVAAHRLQGAGEASGQTPEALVASLVAVEIP